MAENNDNDDASVDSSGPYDPVDFDEDTLRLLKENHRDIESLEVTFHGAANPNRGFDPLSIDWESDGAAISENTRLRCIEIWDSDQPDREAMSARDQRGRIRNAKAFYRAVALNKFIKYLTVQGGDERGVDMEDVISILAPCLRESPKLCYFVVGGDISARTAQLLASALTSCTPTLSTFGLKRVNGMTAASMTKILDAIKSSSIEELNLDENTISDEVATVLGNALPTLSNLKTLSLAGDYDMRYGSITVDGVCAISDGLENSSVESLSFHRNLIGPNGGVILAEALSSHKVKVKKLDLIQSVSPYHAEFILSDNGWETFFDFLQSSGLVDLKLGGNSIEDAQIDQFAECLNAMTALESLNLWNVTQVTTSGWARFFAGLRENTTLATLKMYSVGADNVNCDVIRPSLCDYTTIEGICNSNHTLFKVEGPWELWDSDSPEASETLATNVSECKRLFEMNKGEDKAEVARRKILEFYFRNGDENLQELVTMEANLMPRVLACVGRDGIKVSYQLIRSMPSLFSAKTLSGKRKRGTTASE